MLRTEQRRSSEDQKLPKIMVKAKIKITAPVVTLVEVFSPALNISGSGMCFFTGVEIKIVPNAAVKPHCYLEFRLPDEITFIKCQAKVVRCQKSEKDGLYEVGVEFSDITDADREEICELVEAHLPKGR